MWAPVAALNEGNGKIVKVHTSTPRKITFVCACQGIDKDKDKDMDKSSSSGCDYKVRGSLCWDNEKKNFCHWEVQEYSPHTCPDDTVIPKGHKTSNYSPEQLIPAFAGTIMDKECMSLPSLQSTLQLYLHRKPNKYFAARVRDSCIVEVWGKEEVLTDQLAAYMRVMEVHGHRVTIKTASKQEVEDISMASKRGAISPHFCAL